MSAKVVWCPLLRPLTVRDQLGRLLAFDTEEFVHAVNPVNALSGGKVLMAKNLVDRNPKI
jgi:hypothetical protein